MKKIIICLLVCFLGVISLTSCGNSYKDLDKIKKSGVLTIATNAEFPPFEYVDADKNITGFDMELIKEFGKSIDVKVEIKNMDFDAALTSVQKGQVDLAVAAITKNEKREKVMDFTKPYFKSSQYVVVKKDSLITGTSIDTLRASLTENKAVIGVQEGTTGNFYANGDTDWGYETIADTKVKSYTNGGLAITALLNDQVSCVLIDELPAKSYVDKNSDELKLVDVSLTEEEYAIAATKGNKSLIDALNEFIDKIKNDGTYNKLMEETMAQ